VVSAAFDALVGHADGRKERDRGGLDDARKEAMLQLARSLSLTGEHLHVMHDSIKRRIRSALHHGDDLQSIVSRSKRQLCSIVSCNMRGMRNKCTSLNGTAKLPQYFPIGNQIHCRSLPQDMCMWLSGINNHSALMVITSVLLRSMSNPFGGVAPWIKDRI